MNNSSAAKLRIITDIFKRNILTKYGCQGASIAKKLKLNY